ncbi:Vps53-like protein, partial [Conidiobolus coronatus NRRL 28638]
MEHPLDSPKFSTVEFINNLLPTPSSLTNSNSKVIQNILTNLKSQINQVDTDLQTLVRNQIQLSVPLEEVSNLAPNLKTLVSRVDRVQDQAIQTEASVSEITVDQLKLHAQNKQYREAGQLIQAVEQLFSHLTTFNNLKVIVELEKSSFNGLGKLAYPAEPLSEANTILDLIDPNARKPLITWYIDLQLQDYLSIFRGDDEVGALDNTSRRFAWLKRWFQMFDQEHSSIFPGDWHVDYKLAKKFCELTYGDLVEVLEKTASSNVNLVITSMQLTVAFEHQLDKRYSHLLQAKSDSF